MLPNILNSFSNIHELPLICNEDAIIANYSPQSIKALSATTTINPIGALSERSFLRMQSQLGVFTLMHRDKIPIETIDNKQHIWRYIIPAKSKILIRNELLRLRVNRHTLFPEIESLNASVLRREE